VSVRLTPAQKRVAALALAAAAAGLVYGGIVYPVLEAHRQFNQRIGDLGHRLGQYKRLAQDRAALQSTLEQHKRADAARNYYLAEHNPALAAAELQGLLKRAVDQARGELVSTQMTGGQRAERSAEVSVKLQVRGDIRTLQRLLYSLESARPLLFVNQLSVSAAPLARTPKGPLQSAVKELVIILEVSAYTREGQA
jgi:general secretion pathway protein M